MARAEATRRGREHGDGVDEIVDDGVDDEVLQHRVSESSRTDSVVRWIESSETVRCTESEESSCEGSAGEVQEEQEGRAVAGVGRLRVCGRRGGGRGAGGGTELVPPVHVSGYG